ncbi:MAG: carbon-nitrogen hydrolase family protein, partial [Armatimonadota bacterium]
EANWAKAERMVRDAAAAGAELVCAPEGFLEGYIVQEKGLTRAKYRSIGESVRRGPYVRKMRGLCAELRVGLCAGFAERTGPRMYNSAALIGRRGEVIGVFRKVHDMGAEPLNTRGDDFPVFDTESGPIGIMICFDRQLPETARLLALRGAKLVLNPSAGMHGETNDIMMRTRAYENGVWVIFSHPKDCLIISPKGEIVARAHGPDEVVLANIDLAQAGSGGPGRHRRPEVYRDLSNRRLRFPGPDQR